MTAENKTVHLAQKVPFYSQRLDESNYKDEGFTNIAKARFWSSRVCGLACVKMAIDTFQHKNISLAELLTEGLEMRAYNERSGWYHQGLVNLVKLYGLHARRESVWQNVDKIGQYIESNELVIASVTVGFEAGKVYKSKRGNHTMPRGGHLVVIFGAEMDNKDRVKHLILHHPSSWKSYEFKSLNISRNEFLHSFSLLGNIIRISKHQL